MISSILVLFSSLGGALIFSHILKEKLLTSKKVAKPHITCRGAKACKTLTCGRQLCKVKFAMDKVQKV
jgi:hypothetical protein